MISLTCVPGLITPGQRRRSGTRCPPSHALLAVKRRAPAVRPRHDLRAVVRPRSRLRFLLQVRPDMHAGRVEPHEEGLSSFTALSINFSAIKIGAAGESFLC